MNFEKFFYKIFHILLFFLILCCGFDVNRAYGQDSQVVLRGTVTGLPKGLPVSDATISLYSPDGTFIAATTSDTTGRYTFRGLTAGDYIIRFTHIGFETNQNTKKLSPPVTIYNIRLRPQIITLDEINVPANRKADSSGPILSELHFNTVDIHTTAGANSDVLNLIKVTPGVITTGDYSNQLIVRGGNPDQNLFIIDGIEIYSPYQSSGIGSVFNPRLIRSLTLYSGAFPARYGDRLSSVIEIETRNGSDDKPFQGAVDLNMSLASLTMEGQTGFWNGSWILSGRQSYYHTAVNAFSQRLGNYNDIAYPIFHDLQGKISLKPATAHTLNALLLYSGDTIDWVLREDEFGEMEFDDSQFQGQINTKNAAASVDWTYNPNRYFQSRLSANWHRNRGDNDLMSNLVPGLEKQTGPDTIFPPQFTADDTLSIRYLQNIHLDRFSANGNVDLFAGPHMYTFGVSLRLIKNQLDAYSVLNQEGQEVFSIIESASPILETLADSVQTSTRHTQFASYLQGQLNFFENRLSIRPGLRFSHYGINSKYVLSPRISLSFNPWSSLTLQASLSHHSQSPGYEKLLRPDETFAIARYHQIDHLRPEEARHFIFGSRLRVNNTWKIGIEGYYKLFEHLITPSYEMREVPVARYFPTNHQNITRLDPENYRINLAEQLAETDLPNNSESGDSYGMELLLQKNPSGDQTFYGWLSYSYSISTRYNDATGVRVSYPFDYDRRHSLNMVLQKPFGEHWQAGITWQYGSGFPFTPAVNIQPMMYKAGDSGYLLTDPETGYIRMTPDYGNLENKNSARHPGYNRIDFKLSYTNATGNLGYRFYLDLINLTNRKNIKSYKYILVTEDPNPPDLSPTLRRPSDAVLYREPVYMLPLIPTLGFALSF